MPFLLLCIIDSCIFICSNFSILGCDILDGKEQSPCLIPLYILGSNAVHLALDRLIWWLMKQRGSITGMRTKRIGVRGNPRNSDSVSSEKISDTASLAAC